MDTTTTAGTSWSDWLQGVAGTVIDAKVKSWNTQQQPVSISPYGQSYPDGRPATSSMNTSGISSTVMIAGAVVVLAVLLLKR